jgi:hypothetical protein
MQDAVFSLILVPIKSGLSMSRRPRFLPLYIRKILNQELQTLRKNLFNLINYWEYLYSIYSLKIFQKPSVKGTLRYQKINFFTTSVTLKCIIGMNDYQSTTRRAKKPAQILYPAYRIKDAVMIVKINFLYNI